MIKKIFFSSLAVIAYSLAMAGDSRQAIRDAWIKLPSSTNTCGDYDYFPDGGMRTFGCHTWSLFSYATLVKIAGIPAYVGGPHDGKQLILSAKNRFGHYNPAFVDWLGNHLIPGANDEKFRADTQPVYDSYIRSLARIFFVVYKKTEHEPACFEREVNRYVKMLNDKQVEGAFHERFFYFMNKKYCADPAGQFSYKYGFDGGYNGNIVKTTVAFWIRRTLDGTAMQFAEALTLLLETYDRDFLQKNR